MTDIERVTQLAEEYGFVRTQFHGSDDYFYQATAEQILDYTQKVEQAVLANRASELKSIASNATFDVISVKKDLFQATQEIESLQAKLAMQAYALSNIRHDQKDEANRYIYTIANDALNATQPTVDAFMAKKKAEWEKERNPKCATHGYGCGMHESTCRVGV